MVNMLRGLLTAPLADTVRAHDDFASCGLPSYTVSAPSTAAPPWMRRSSNEIRLPLRHASATTEIARAVEVAGWPSKECEADLARFLYSITSPWIASSDLCRDSTRHRTELLIASPCHRDIGPAGTASIGLLLPPSCGERALSGTESTPPSVEWVEGVSAEVTVSRLSASRHDDIVAREERYCAIAARRVRETTPPLPGLHEPEPVQACLPE